MPYHAIIIPERNRKTHLAVCRASIRHSAQVCGVTDYEIRVVDGDDPPVRLGQNQPMPYWKAHYVNLGIDSTDSRYISFLDADAVVGERWFDAILWLGDDSLTKMAYRVRYAPYAPWPGPWPKRFGEYDKYKLGFEGYRTPDCDRHWTPDDDAKPVPCFGNSQFSIRRAVLGDLRMDERYIGRGFEDIDFNRRIAERYGDRYRCVVTTDGQHALFNIQHPQTAGYQAGPWNARNQRLYYGQARTWYVCPDTETAEQKKAMDPHAEVVTPMNEWRLSLAIPGLDTIVHVEGASDE